MPGEKIDTLVVGGGQAGVAMSEHLGRAAVPHLVLEKDRIAEAWRSGRWDALVANGPACMTAFPAWNLPAMTLTNSSARTAWRATLPTLPP